MAEEYRFTNRRDCFEIIARKYPRREEAVAAYALGLLASWRVFCGKTGRNPDDTGDVRKTTPPTAAEAEEMRRWKEEAARQAHAVKDYGSPHSFFDLEQAFLLMNNRDSDGRKFADA